MSTTIQRDTMWSVEKIRRSYGRSPLLRVDAIRADAARACKRWIDMQAKHLWPLVSGQVVSELRQRGGSVAGVVILMLALPHRALEIAAYLTAHAVSISGTVLPEFAAASRAEQVADSLDDVAQLDAAYNPTRENLLRLRDAWTASLAATQTALAALERKLEDVQ